MAKQKLKGYYGNIGEKQFRKYYEEAVRRKGDTSENLIELLERRLDAVIYRMKFAVTPFAARQFVNHGHVTDQRQAPQHPFLPGQGQRRDRGEGEVEAAHHACSMPRRAASATCRSTSRWTTARCAAASCARRSCRTCPIPVQMEPNLVVEFYSR